MSTAIDTAKVTNRRQLQFSKTEDIIADVEKLAAAREIRTLGNWSSGQVFMHLANTMNKSMDGFNHRLPWPIRVIARVFIKRGFLKKPMKAGFQLPAKSAAELICPSATTEEGLQNIRKALHRLQTEDHREPSAFLGPMTRDEWEKLHCRHSELHLSFLIPVT